MSRMKIVFKQMKKYKEDYPNYIYVFLTMDLERLFWRLLVFSMSFYLQRNTQRIKDFAIMHWCLHQTRQSNLFEKITLLIKQKLYRRSMLVY